MCIKYIFMSNTYNCTYINHIFNMLLSILIYEVHNIYNTHIIYIYIYIYIIDNN